MASSQELASRPDLAVPARSTRRQWPEYARRLRFRRRGVAHLRIGCRLLHARAVFQSKRRPRVPDSLFPRSSSDHEDGARAIARADEDVLGPGRTVDKIPWSQRDGLAFDEQEALA